MSDFFDLYNWAGWKFGQFEYRLCGYLMTEGKARCIVSEPILGVNVEEQYVETIDHLKFKLSPPIEKVHMMDMMYALDRWMNHNVKSQPAEATEMVLEALGRTKKDDNTVQ